MSYNRHPLCTFVKDTTKGQTSGEGLDAFGATTGWPTVKARAEEMFCRALGTPCPRRRDRS